MYAYGTTAGIAIRVGIDLTRALHTYTQVLTQLKSVGFAQFAQKKTE